MGLRYNVIFAGVLTMGLYSCTALKVITSKNYKPQNYTNKEVMSFLKKHNFDDYPVLTLNKTFADTLPAFYFNFGVFNKNGDFINLHTKQNCYTKEYFYNAFNYILKYGDTNLITNVVVESIYVPKDTLSIINITGDRSLDTKIYLDTSLWISRLKEYRVHLDIYAPFLTNLKGEKVDVNKLYLDYLVIQEFKLSGQRSLMAIYMKRIMKNVKTLEKKFGKRVQLIFLFRNDNPVAN